MKLTQREDQVMSLIATGMRTNQIAHCMGISKRTVHAHLNNIYNKFGVVNRAGALVMFLQGLQNSGGMSLSDKIEALINKKMLENSKKKG